MKLLFLLSFYISLFSNQFQPVTIYGLSPDKNFSSFIKDNDLVSPKSAIYDSSSNLYINALESSKTVIYSSTMVKKPSIVHHFTSPGPVYAGFPSDKFQPFFGKPVESVIDNQKHILYVSSYRKSCDANSIHQSSISIIDLNTGSILYTLPTKSIPKVLALSNDNKILSVSNWGDNSLSLWDVSQAPTIIKFLKNIKLGKSINQNSIKVCDKDKECGLCLRGTVFSLNNQFIISSGLHSGNSIFLINPVTSDIKHINVSFSPIRHIVKSSTLKRYYFSTTGSGQVCSVNDIDMLNSYANGSFLKSKCKSFGSPIRTIAINEKEGFGVAALNASCKVAIFDLTTLETKQVLPAPCYPVGVAIAPSGKEFVVTAQGKNHIGGHKVGLYNVIR